MGSASGRLGSRMETWATLEVTAPKEFEATSRYSPIIRGSIRGIASRGDPASSIRWVPRHQV